MQSKTKKAYAIVNWMHIQKNKERFSPLFIALFGRVHRVICQLVFSFSLIRKSTATIQCKQRFHPWWKKTSVEELHISHTMAVKSGVLQHQFIFHININSDTLRSSLVIPTIFWNSICMTIQNAWVISVSFVSNFSTDESNKMVHHRYLLL
jgi:hypothetical protein